MTYTKMSYALSHNINELWNQLSTITKENIKREIKSKKHQKNKTYLKTIIQNRYIFQK